MAGRPKKDDAKIAAVQVRLDEEQLAGLDRLIELKQQELRMHGVEFSRASFLRGLLIREIEAMNSARKGKR